MSACAAVSPQWGKTPLDRASARGHAEVVLLLQQAPQPWWSPECLPLWLPAARQRGRAFMLMLRRGRTLRARPEDDPHDHFAHALPTEVEVDVLGAVGTTWLL